jgi:hypothetical protein
MGILLNNVRAEDFQPLHVGRSKYFLDSPDEGVVKI